MFRHTLETDLKTVATVVKTKVDAELPYEIVVLEKGIIRIIDDPEEIKKFMEDYGLNESGS